MRRPEKLAQGASRQPVGPERGALQGKDSVEIGFVAGSDDKFRSAVRQAVQGARSLSRLARGLRASARHIERVPRERQPTFAASEEEWAPPLICAMCGIHAAWREDRAPPHSLCTDAGKSPSTQARPGPHQFEFADRSAEASNLLRHRLRRIGLASEGLIVRAFWELRVDNQAAVLADDVVRFVAQHPAETLVGERNDSSGVDSIMPNEWSRTTNSRSHEYRGRLKDNIRRIPAGSRLALSSRFWNLT